MTSTAFRLPCMVAVIEEVSEDQDTAYLARLPEGPIVVLRDTALLIWREAVTPSGEGSLHSRVAKAYGVSEEEVQTAVEECVADLIERRVLERDSSA